MAEKGTEITPTRREGRISRRTPWSAAGMGPFGALERLADEMDRIFEDFGVGRRWLTSPFARTTGAEVWAPDVEVFHRGNELVVRADLPGMKKEDVKVDLTEDSVTIQGERHHEQEEEREGVYRSERSYGRFSRTIPLPEGAITEQAKARLRDGVLEITMPAPPEQVMRGRRLDVTEESKK